MLTVLQSEKCSTPPTQRPGSLLCPAVKPESESPSQF